MLLRAASLQSRVRISNVFPHPDGLNGSMIVTVSHTNTLLTHEEEHRVSEQDGEGLRREKSIVVW